MPNIQITDSYIELINNIIKSNKDNKDGCAYFTDLSTFMSGISFEPQERVLLPHVMIWDPLRKFPCVQQLKCPHCMDEGSAMFVKIPSDPLSGFSITKRNYPRTIHDRGWYCALVGRWYVCSKSHRIISHHVGFLQQIPLRLIPFFVTHTTGMTMTAMDDVVKLVEVDQNFTTITNHLAQSYTETYERRKLNYPGETFKELSELKGINITHSTLRKLFLMNFEVNKGLYQEQLDRISCKHLQLASNIGQFEVNIGYQNANKKWTVLFDRLFMVLNEDCMVKSYGFGSSDEHAVDLFTPLANSNPDDVRFILIDSHCCDFRSHMQSLFPNAHVKYDINHAIQSLREALPDHQKHSEEARREVEFIFRTANDSNKENMRRYPTADASTILLNLGNFVTKWCAEDEDLFIPSVLHEIEKLKSHIQEGCLSEIPAPKLWDTSREKLFRRMQTTLKDKRLNVETACAIVTHLLYIHNCEKKGEVVHKPIWSYRDPNVLGYTTQNSDQEEQTLNESDLAVNLILESDTTEASSTIEFPVSADITSLSTKSEKIVGLVKLFKYLFSRFQKLPVNRQHCFHPFTTLPSEVWDTFKFFGVCSMTDNLVPMQIAALHNTIKLDRMQLSSQNAATRKTLLHAFWFGIREVIGKTHPNVIAEILSLECSGDGNKTDSKFFDQLLDLVVNELTGSHRVFYEKFATEECPFDVLVEKIKTNRDITLKSSALLLHGLSNLLGISFVLVPMNRLTPILPIIPYFQLLVQKPLFVQVGREGENQLQFNMMNAQEIPALEMKGGCGCGSHKKKKQNAERSSLRCMSHACKCHSADQRCSELCSCLNCGNGGPGFINEVKVQFAEQQREDKKRRKRRSFKEPLTMRESLEPKVPQDGDLKDEGGQPEDNAKKRKDFYDAVKELMLNKQVNNVIFEALLFVLLCEKGLGQKQCNDEELTTELYSSYVEFFVELHQSNSLTRDPYLQRMKEYAETDLPVFTEWLQERRTALNHMQTVQLGRRKKKNKSAANASNKRTSDDELVDKQPEETEGEDITCNKTVDSEPKENTMINETGVVEVTIELTVNKELNDNTEVVENKESNDEEPDVEPEAKLARLED